MNDQVRGAFLSMYVTGLTALAKSGRSIDGARIFSRILAFHIKKMTDQI